jgi:hypothetical protein
VKKGLQISLFLGLQEADYTIAGVFAGSTRESKKADISAVTTLQPILIKAGPSAIAFFTATSGERISVGLQFIN